MTLPIAYFIVSDLIQRTIKYAHTTYTKNQDFKASPIRYFIQQLQTCTQFIISNADYNFYILSISKELDINSQMNTALAKLC